MLYRRFDDGMLGAFRTPIGQPLDSLLTEAVRPGSSGWPTCPATGSPTTGRLRLGAGDDPVYLGEEPLLDSVPTWVLADDEHWAQVRDHLPSWS